jgi:hypothetical protein
MNDGSDEIRNSEDILDSRDIEQRLTYLDEFLEESYSCKLSDGEAKVKEELEQERNELQAFKDEVDSGEWDMGLTLIHEDYFEDYAKEQANSTIRDFNEYHWPFNCIDWEEAAEQLQQDYSEADFGSSTYYFN